MKSKAIKFLQTKNVFYTPDGKFEATDEFGESLVADALEEYAQQSQPSGMRWVSASERMPDIDTSDKWNNDNKITKDVVCWSKEWGRRFGRYYYNSGRWSIDGVLSSNQIVIEYWVDLTNPSESSPAGAAEGAPSDNAFMNGGNTESEKSFYAMGYMDRKKASEGMAEALRLKWINLTEDMGRLLSGQRGVSIDKLNKAMNLVQDFVNTMPASLSPGVEDGSGWVKVEDRLPENAGWVNDTVMFWSKKHGHALIGCYDFEFDDWTQQPWTEGAEKLKSSDVTHWRPLPTPPDVEDNQTKKQAH